MPFRTVACAAALLATALSGAPSRASAQPPAPVASADEGGPDTLPAAGRALVRGVVRDADGTPVPDAEVAIFGMVGSARRDGEPTVRTDAEGGYRVANLRPGQYFARVRRLGYEPLHFSMTLARGEGRRIDVELRPLPQQLSAVTVRERSGYGARDAWRMREFDLRRRMGFGRFLTRDDLTRFGRGMQLADALRMQWPLTQCSSYDFDLGAGMNAFDPPGSGGRWVGAGGRCRIAVSIDGTMAMDGGFLIGYPVAWTEAVELYGARNVPIQFSGAMLQGATHLVVVWTGAQSDDEP